jgi:PPM family protein phosphatase
VTLVARPGALTDIGLHRKTNEDAYVVAPPLFAVCDGMGGAQAGEVASALASETLAAEVAAGQPLLAAAEAANTAVYARASGDVDHSGMGTTLTAFVLEAAVAHFVHIGDSRAYLLREGELQQLSDDHSLVGEMVREGRLTEEEAATHPHRSILSRALGTEPSVRIDEFEVDLRGGDVLLLCSDGLSGVVDAVQLAKALGRSDPDEAARRLIAEARKQGGPDNITAVVVRLETPDPGAVSDDDEVTLAVSADEAVTVVEPAPVPLAPGPGAEGDSAAGTATAAPAVPVDPAPFGDTVVAAAGAAVAATAAGDDPDDDEDTGEIPVEEVEAAIAAGESPAAPVHPVPELPDAASPAEQRRRGLGCLTVVLALLVLLGIGGAVTLSTVYYVGVDDGRLALYSGLPADVGPLHLHAVYRRSSVAYDTLSPEQRQLVDERALRGRGDALALATYLGMSP